MFYLYKIVPGEGPVEVGRDSQRAPLVKRSRRFTRPTFITDGPADLKLISQFRQSHPERLQAGKAAFKRMWGSEGVNHDIAVAWNEFIKEFGSNPFLLGAVAQDRKMAELHHKVISADRVNVKRGAIRKALARAEELRICNA